MENEERSRIKRNRLALITHTKCDNELLIFCLQSGVLGVADVDAIKAEKQELEQADVFYQIIQTRSNSYPILIKALHATGQSDIVTILETGLVPQTSTEISRANEILYGKGTPIFEVSPAVPLFTGRRKELEELHKKVLRSHGKPTVISQLTSISGLGGIGKTQLSRQYVQEHRQDFDDNCIWLNAETEDSLSESFVDLAKDKLGIKTGDANGSDKKIQTVVKDVYRFFERRRCLFIFDNAERTDWFKQFLPIASPPAAQFRPHIIITSRSCEWDKGIEVIELNELELEDAINLVKKGLCLEEDAAQDDVITKLVKRLQCFPLAIQQAISYIADQQEVDDYGISDYLEEFERRQLELLSFDEMNSELYNDYNKTTLTTWRMTVEKIGQSKHGIVALNVLYAMAYLSPDKIKRELFLNLESTTSRDEVIGGVRLLVKYSMVRGEERQSLLSIHRLVQEVTRLELACQQMEEKIIKGVIGILEEKNKIQENLSHQLTAWVYAWNYPEVVRSFCHLPTQICAVLHDKGRDLEAGKFGTEAVKKLTNVLGEEHYEIVNILVDTALALNHVGRIEEALNMMLSAYDNMKHKYGEHHIRTLYPMSNIGNIYSQAGMFVEAFHFYSKSYEIIKMLNWDNDIITPLHVADTLRMLNRAEEAVQLIWDQYLRYKMHLDKETDIYVRKIIGYCLNDVIDFNGAAEILQEHSEDMNDLSTEEKMDYADLLFVFGTVLRNKGDFTGALDKHQEAYQMGIGIYGVEHPQCTIYAAEIAKDLISMGKYENGIYLLEDAFDKVKLLKVESNFRFVRAKVDFANALAKLGRNDVERALVILREQKGIIVNNENAGNELSRLQNEMVLGEIRKTNMYNAVSLISIWKIMGECLNKLGDFQGALEILDATPQDMTQLSGLERLEMFELLRVFGDVLRSNGNFEAALQKHRQALEGTVAVFGKHNSRSIMCSTDVAMDLCIMGKHEEGVILLEEAVSRLETLGGNDFHVVRVKIQLADVLTRRGGEDDLQRRLTLANEQREKIEKNSWADLVFFKDEVCKPINRIEGVALPCKKLADVA